MSSTKTPSGFYPLTGELAHELNIKRGSLVELYTEKGFELVTCPIINFASSSTSFKFSDSLSQNDLEIIDDLTPQVSNIDSTSLGVKKYCYAQNIVKSHPDDFYSSRSPLQVGAEIYGEPELHADIEVIELMVNSLVHLGISDITLVLGNIAVFNAVVSELGLSAHADELKEIFASKSLPDLRLFIDTHQCSEALMDYLASGDISGFKLSQLSDELHLMQSLEANIQGVEVIIDPTDTKTYDYHSGLIFSAYSQKYPKAIARGGRFISDAGRCGTGFSFDLQFLLQH